jgi:hypothetical protein
MHLLCDVSAHVSVSSRWSAQSFPGTDSYTVVPTYDLRVSPEQHQQLDAERPAEEYWVRYQDAVSMSLASVDILFHLFILSLIGWRFHVMPWLGRFLGSTSSGSVYKQTTAQELLNEM